MKTPILVRNIRIKEAGLFSEDTAGDPVSVQSSRCGGKMSL